MARRERNGRASGGDGFWSQPQWMNLAADLLLVFGVVVLAWAAVSGLKRLPIYPLRELVVVGTVERVSRAQIAYAARTALAGNLLGVDLDAARLAFEKLPWVRRAELRRRWPDSLELALEEHVAVARWSPAGEEQRLVNSHGEVFAGAVGDELPSFSGPEGSAAAMLARYREFDAQLERIQRKAVALTLSARDAWQVRLDDGVLVELGRDQARQPMAERLVRFADHYLAARERVMTPIAVVDLRYPNGFALRLGPPERKSAS